MQNESFVVVSHSDCRVYSVSGGYSVKSKNESNKLWRTKCKTTAKFNLDAFSSSGVPKVVQSRFSLPLALVCVPSSPTKATKFKITVDTNQAPVDLISIFPGENTHT